MRSRLVGFVLSALLCGCGGGGGGDGSGTAVGGSAETPATKTKKVLVIGIDGLRPDALDKADTPHLDALRAEGVYSARGQATDTTWSGSGWSTILHGVWRDKHGVVDNTFAGAKYAQWPDFFTRLEQKAPALVTERIASWSKMQTTMPTGADKATNSSGDADTVQKAVAALGGNPDVLFVYFYDVDAAGHASGFHPHSIPYVKQIEEVDGQIGTILAALQARPTYAQEDWLVVVTSDHGGAWDGHGKDRPEDRTIPMIVSGPSVQGQGGEIHPDPAQVDVAPTVFAHLGIPVDPAWGFDGKPLGLEATPGPALAFGTNLIANPDAETQRGFSASTPNAMASGWTDAGAATIAKYGTSDFPGFASPGPSDRGANFFSGGASLRSSLQRRISLQPMATIVDSGGVGFTVSGWLGGVGAEDDSAQVTVRFLKPTRRAAVSAPNGRVYFFSGPQYWRVDPATGQVEAGYPKAITAGWPGVFADGVDAALEGANGKIYFFRDAQYVRFDWTAGAVDAGYPKPILGFWPGLERFAGGAANLDAAVNWGNGKAYFFKGDEYVRYDLGTDVADLGYPRRISHATWNDLGVWSCGIEAAVGWPSDADRAYFFKHGEYVRFKKSADAPYDAIYPRRTDATTWPGLSDWHFDPAKSVVLGPVKAADRGGATGLVFRTASGFVPAGTRTIEVEVLFRRASGTNNDGCADNLSLTLFP